MASNIDDDIDTSLPAETSGANAGKVLKTTFTTCLGKLKAIGTTAKAEISILQASVEALFEDKQDVLVSGTNIKTINGESVLGAGNLTVAGGATNLSATASPTNVVVASDTGNDATIAAADATNAGLMLPAEKTKLAGIASGAQVNTVNSVAGRQGDVTLTKSDVGLGSVDNTADASKAVLSATRLATPRTINGQAFDGTANITINAVDATARIASTEKGAANGVATLGADSKIPTSQLPALAVVNTYVVNSQAAQLALTTQEGDVAVRTDLNKTFIRLNTSLGTMADWQEMLTPTDTVLSVNGQTGAITLTTTNIAEGTNQYFTAQRVRDALLTGLSVATNAAVVAADSFLVAIGKLQAQISGYAAVALTFTNKTISGANNTISDIAQSSVTNLTTDLAAKAGLSLSNIFTGRNRFSSTIGTWQTETYSATQALDATKPFGVLTLTGNVTFDSVTGAGAAGEAQVLYREVKQDATGSRTASYNTANFEKVGAAFPVLSSGANARDFLTFTRSQNGKWLVTAGLNVS